MAINALNFQEPKNGPKRKDQNIFSDRITDISSGLPNGARKAEALAVLTSLSKFIRNYALEMM